VYDIELGVFVVSRDVVFNEEEFPYQATSLGEQIFASPALETSVMIEDDINGQSGTTIDHLPVPLTDDVSVVARDVGSDESDQMSKDKEDASAETERIEVVDAFTVEPDVANVSGGSNDISSNECLGKGQRKKFPSIRLQGYVANTVCKSSPSQSLSILSHA
jgi:hypothetical protein